MNTNLKWQYKTCTFWGTTTTNNNSGFLERPFSNEPLLCAFHTCSSNLAFYAQSTTVVISGRIRFIQVKNKTNRNKTKKVTSKHNINTHKLLQSDKTTVKGWQMKMHISGCIWGMLKLNAWSVWKTVGMTTFKDLLSYVVVFFQVQLRAPVQPCGVFVRAATHGLQYEYHSLCAKTTSPVKYFCIPFKGKPGCHKWIAKTTE